MTSEQVRRGRIVAVVVALALGSGGREALAELGGRPPPLAGSVHGGGVDLPRGGALSTGAGLPSVYAQYDFPASGRFGIGVRGDFLYMMPVWGFDVGLGFAAEVPMRIELLDRDRWNLALLLDAGLFMGFTEDWYEDFWWRDDEVFFIGPNLGFGLVASVRPVSSLSIFFGLRIPIYIFILVPDEDDADARVFAQVQFHGGVEFSVARNVALFFRVGIGPSFGPDCDRPDPEDVNECGDWDVEARFSLHAHFGATFFFGTPSRATRHHGPPRPRGRTTRPPARRPADAEQEDDEEEDDEEEEEDEEEEDEENEEEEPGDE